MSTIITRNSATSGSTPSSLVQGELAINVTDGRLFYGSGSGNVVKEFTGSASGGGTINTGSFVTTSSFNNYTGSNTSQFAGTASFALSASYAISASYEINYETSSSYADFAVSASHASTASYYNEKDPIFVAKSASLATTGSNIFKGNQTISGSIYLGSGSIISESGSTIIISPPGALPGQSLVLRPTATSLISNHPSGFYPGDSIIITFTPTGIATTGTGSYTFTGCTEVQLGTPLTGSILFNNQISQSLTWTVPALSDITGFTFNIYNFDTFVSNSISLSSSGSSENNHLHLISGNPTTTDLYLGDDDQYIKIEKNAGNVVIGTNLDTYQWVFDTNGSSTVPGNITFPSGSFISSTNISGNIYISALNDGILHLNDDGGEGDVWMLNGQNKLRIEGDAIITGSLHQSGTFYPDQIDWFSSSIGYDTGSYILTTMANGLTTYAGYGDVADTLAPYIPTVSSSVSASYATNGGVTQIIAGPNITVSPTTGVGQVTISSTGGGGGTGNTATGSYGSFYSTQTQTNVASTARSMSLNTTDITNGVSISGSTNPYNTYIKTENAGVYDIQFSAQVDKTDSGTDEIWIWLRKNGINVTDSATSIQLVGNGAHYVAAWNFFVNAAANDYFQLMWYSPDANVRLHAEAGFGVVPGIPSLIVTANRVDQFLSNTGSFSGSFTGNLIGTASYATQALSASYATTASYSNTSTSASFALSASYAPSTPAFPYTGSAEITGSLGVTGSLSTQTYDGILANAYVPAIKISDGGRNIYDIFGTGSIDAGGRILIDNIGGPSLSWLSRTMFDSAVVQSIDWANRIAYDAGGTNYSIDWGSRLLYDHFNIQSITWDIRELIDSSGSSALNWDTITNNFKIAAYTYLKKFIDPPTQESFSDVPITAFNYEGEVIAGGLDGTVNQFDLVYLETDGKWYPVTQGTADCSKLLGICATTGVKPEIILEGSITVNDSAFNDSPTVQLIDHGLPIYIRENAGNTMSTNVPTTAGQYVRILGHAYYQNTSATNYWIMKFRPSNDWIVI